jgi:hypothetical protein
VSATADVESIMGAEEHSISGEDKCAWLSEEAEACGRGASVRAPDVQGLLGGVERESEEGV